MNTPTAAGPSVESIDAMLRERRADRGLYDESLRAIRDAYNGDVVIPLPEMDRAEIPVVANLVSLGLDQQAARIASTSPDVYYPPLRPGIKVSEDRATRARRATLAWYETNKLMVKDHRRARHLIGYASSPVMLRPDMKKGIARWEPRNPMGTYACPTGDPDDMTPPDVIFTYIRAYGWLTARYPEKVAGLRTGTDRPKPSDLFEVVEYVDSDVIVLAVRGKTQNDDIWTPAAHGASIVELERLPNRAGVCTAVVASRITLDRPMGQFDGITGMLQTQAKLMALQTVAVERGIFPDTYLISRPGETARFISGPHDGRTGAVNIVQGGDVKDLGLNPGFATIPLIDHIERNMRVEAGIPSQFGGEVPTNVRTGKAGDAVMSAIVDFPVQEAQLVLAAAREEETKIAISIAKAYFGNQKRSFYVSAKKDAGHVDYVPNKDFEVDPKVTYPMAGADQNGLIIGLGQRVGMGTMSKRTAAELDPMIADADRENGRVETERLREALFASILQQAQQGVIPPEDVAFLVKAFQQDNMAIEDAVVAAHKRAQQRQATPAPAQAPETMAGLGAPGMGAEQPTIGPSPDEQGLASLLNTLRTPQRMNAGERGPVAA